MPLVAGIDSLPIPVLLPYSSSLPSVQCLFACSLGLRRRSTAVLLDDCCWPFFTQMLVRVAGIGQHENDLTQLPRAGPSSRPPLSVALESKSAPAPLKCDAATQTSDFSDREERRLRTSRLRRESRGAVLEGTVSISPEPTAGPCQL